jgi:hypothetical protein
MDFSYNKTAEVIGQSDCIDHSAVCDNVSSNKSSSVKIINDIPISYDIDILPGETRARLDPNPSKEPVCVTIAYDGLVFGKTKRQVIQVEGKDAQVRLNKRAFHLYLKMTQRSSSCDEDVEPAKSGKSKGRKSHSGRGTYEAQIGGAIVANPEERLALVRTANTISGMVDFTIQRESLERTPEIVYELVRDAEYTLEIVFNDHDGVLPSTQELLWYMQDTRWLKKSGYLIEEYVRFFEGGVFEAQILPPAMVQDQNGVSYLAGTQGIFNAFMVPFSLLFTFLVSPSVSEIGYIFFFIRWQFLQFWLTFPIELYGMYRKKRDQQIFVAQADIRAFDVLCSGRCESCEIQESWLPEGEVIVPVEEKTLRERYGEHLPCLYLPYRLGAVSHGIDCSLGFAKCIYKLREEQCENLTQEIGDLLERLEIQLEGNSNSPPTDIPRRMSRHQLFRLSLREGIKIARVEPEIELLYKGNVDAPKCLVENHGTHVVIVHQKECPHEEMQWGNMSILPIAMHKLMIERGWYKCQSQQRGHLYQAQGWFTPEIQFSAASIDAFNRLTDSLKSIPAPQAVTTALGDLSSKVTGDIQKLMLQIPALFALTLSTIELSREFSAKWLGIFTIAAGVIVTLVDGPVSATIKNMITNLKEKFTSFKAQGDSDGPFTDLVKLFLVVISIGTIGKSDFKIERWIALVGAMPRAGEGFGTICDWISELLGKAINFIRTEMLGLDSVAWVSDSDPQIVCWCEKVVELVNRQHRGDLPVNASNAEKVFKAYSEGNHLLSSVKKGRLYEALKVHKTMLMRLFQPFESIGMVNAGPRMEPIGILLSGESNIGKSYSIFPIILKTLRRLLSPAELVELDKNFNSHVYVHISGNEFMDNYKSQMIAVIDDFGQARDCVGSTTSDYLDVIRMVNMFPFICHMAALENKGNTVFRSKILLATTNLPRINPQSIEQPEAVRRRFHICYKVAPKLEYCIEGTGGDLSSRRLNLKHPNLAASIGFNPDIYEFHEFNPLTSELTGKVIRDIDILVDQIVEEYQQRELKSNNYLAYLSNLAKAPQGWQESIFKAQAGEETGSYGLTEAQQQFINEALEEFDREDDISSVGDLNELEKMVQMQTIDEIEEFDLELLAEAARYTRNPISLMRIIRRENEKLFSECSTPRQFRRCLELLSRLQSWHRLLAEADNTDTKEVSTLTKAMKVVKDFAQTIKEKSKSLLSRYPILTWIAGLAAMSTVIIGALKYFSGGIFAESEGYHAKGSRRRARRNIRQVKSIHVAEGGADKNADEITKSMLRNMYRLYTPNGNAFGNMVMVYGRIGIIPYHFVSSFKRRIQSGELTPDSLIGCKNAYMTKVYEVPVSCFTDCVQTDEMKKLDLCALRLPKYVHPHRDTTEWWISENDVHKPLDFSVQLVIPDEVGRRAYVTDAQPIDQFKVSDSCDIWTVRRGFLYYAPTTQGDCGGILTIVDPSIRGKLLGIHTAGQKDQVGISSTVTNEIITNLKKVLPDIAAPETIFGAQLNEMPFDGNFVAISQSDKAIEQPPVNKIFRSALYEAWGPAKKAPSRLRAFTNAEGELIDPRIIAVQKYGKKMPIWQDPKRIEICMRAGFRKFTDAPQLKNRHTPKVFTFEEAILGIPGVDYCDSINRMKSSGFPWVLDPKPGLPGKTRFFGQGEEFDLTGEECQELKRQVEKVIETAKEGKRSLHVYVDNLKDELRSHAKVQKGATRLFSGSPIVLLIVMRMYFLDFAMAVQQSRIDNEILIGINPYSSEWDRLARRQQEKGTKNSAGDFSGFDTDHQGQRIEPFTRCVNEWYGDGATNALIREVLMEEIISSIHIFGSLIYMWTMAFPSGSFLTAILNSFINKCLMREAWCLLHPRGVQGLPDFDTHVNLAVYGDDNVINESDLAADFFNQKTLEQAMSTLGYTYTDDSKGLKSNKLFRDIGEITILKRSFRWDEGMYRYLAPEELDTVLEIPYWVKSKTTIEHITKQNVETSLRELSLHSKEVFGKWMPQIVKACQERLHYTPLFVDYETLQELTTNMEHIY